MIKTKITKLRINSTGLPATIENAEHHAELVLPMIHAMAPRMAHLGFKEWSQGNNVHLLIAEDDRKFILRPIAYKDYNQKPSTVYHGIRVSLMMGPTYDEQIRLTEITTVEEVPELLEFLKRLALLQQGHLNSGPEKEHMEDRTRVIELA